MKPAWGMNVLDRYREDHFPGKPAKPAEHPWQKPLPALADDVVTVIDRREERVEMSGGPPFARRGHQDQGGMGPRQRPAQRLAPAQPKGRDDDAVDRTSPLGDQLFK